MMRIAMIPVVQSKNSVAVVIQESSRAQDIPGINAALPPMQQHDQALGVSVRLLGVKPLKPYIVDWVKDHFFCGLQHGILPPFPYTAASQHGLDKGVSEIERWIKNFSHGREEAATFSSSFTLSATIDFFIEGLPING